MFANHLTHCTNILMGTQNLMANFAQFVVKHVKRSQPRVPVPVHVPNALSIQIRLQEAQLALLARATSGLQDKTATRAPLASPASTKPPRAVRRAPPVQLALSLIQPVGRYA